jgi:hypothetical protein
LGRILMESELRNSLAVFTFRGTCMSEKKIKLTPFAKSLGFDQDSIEFFVRKVLKIKPQPPTKKSKKRE